MLSSIGRASVLILAMFVLLAACSDKSHELAETDSGATRKPDSDEDRSGGHATRDDVAQPDGNGEEGPSADLVAYLYPLDGAEHEFGWQAFEAPLDRRYWRELGACLMQEGYTAVGQAMLVAEPEYPSEIWRFPRLRRHRERGFLPEPFSEVLNLRGWVGPPLESNDDPFIRYIEETPELELSPTLQAINDFQEAYLDKCLPDVEDSAVLGSAMELWLRWYQLVWEIIDHPDLDRAAQELFECLEGSLNQGRTIENQDGAVTAVDAILFSGDDQVLLQGGQAYAECMEPFIEARRPILAAERERLVQENFGALVAMEQLFVALLDG